jgi:hypothetical protein
MWTSPSFKENIGGLTVIQAVYAFAMALGLREVFLGSRTFMTNVAFSPDGFSLERVLLLSALLLNMMLLGLRFFWVPRNLRGLIFAAVKARGHQGGRLSADEKGKQRKIPLKDITVALHLIVIFLHGSVFYFLCVEFEFIAFAASSTAPFDAGALSGYVVIHVALLLLNSGWIASIQRQEARMRNEASPAKNASAAAGSVWWRNNLLCGLLAIAPLALLSTCGNSGVACLVGTGPGEVEISGLTPFAPDHVYASVVSVFHLFGVDDAFLATGLISVSLAFLLANSLFDLFKTGSTYLLLEEIEWAEPKDGGGSGATGPVTGEGPQ